MIKDELKKQANGDDGELKNKWDEQLSNFQKNLSHMDKTHFTEIINSNDEFALRMKPVPGSIVKLKDDKFYEVSYSSTNNTYRLDKLDVPTQEQETDAKIYNAVQNIYLPTLDSELEKDAIDTWLEKKQNPPN